jgi:hypothetical protein
MSSSRTFRAFSGAVSGAGVGLGACAGLSAALLLSGCADYLTGQLEEPKGPIEVLKLTLSDPDSRDATVFTDTSLPDCKTAPDCTKPESRELRICRICYNDVFKDRYAPHKSVPTPNSGHDIRVVFNKAPLQLDGKELGVAFAAVKDASTTDAAKLALRDSAKLTCSECGGLPPVSRNLFVSGSDVSFDPTSIPYGPSIQLSVDTTDPRAALEPDSSYVVQLAGGIAGRDGEKWSGAGEQAALLKFKTEPFQILRVFGSKNSPDKDEWVYKSQPALSTFDIADQQRSGAVTLVLNAPVYAEGLGTVAVEARKDSGAAIPVGLGSNAFVNPGCKPKSQREVYVFPLTGDWPSDASEVKIRIPAGSIKDVAQGGMFTQGRHSVSGELILNVKFAATAADPHVKNADARLASKCP